MGAGDTEVVEQVSADPGGVDGVQLGGVRRHRCRQGVLTASDRLTVAIDGTGHIRQLRQLLTFKVQHVTVKTITQIEMGDYNAPVSITAPPPDQIALR